MDPDIAERIRDWPSRSIEEAHEGLRSLADADFSGALIVADTWVFVLDGQVVGIRDGTMEGISGTAGTAYQAPGEALPLLFAMQYTDDAESRAQYYTEETPLDSVDDTLSKGGFTGYIELSENVLSGDYYVVYHGGRSRAVAVVGTRKEVILGEEAYQLAADEVGIYDVIEAPISITEIPTVADPSGSAAVPTGGPDDQDDRSQGGQSEADESTGTEATSPEDSGATTDSGEEIGSSSMQESASQSDQTDGETEASAETVDSTAVESRQQDSATRSTAETEESTSSTQESGDETSPAIDREPSRDPSDEDGSRPHTREATERSIRLEELEEELEERTNERDRLRERIDELESGLDVNGDGVDDGERTDREWAQAIGETSLFLRYESRSNPTLEDISDGVEKESFTSNLVLDYHTNFDDTTVSIDGVPFEDALHSSAEWSFFTWLVRDLPFEIRDTGRVGELSELYDALPRIDRVELLESVGRETGDVEPGDIVEFDLICRDKTGNPLVVADIHEGRAPVDGPVVEGLIERTSALMTDTESVAAAYVVSPSFFRPAALKTAQSATASGLLSRDSRLSYVKVDRNAGFHLWLVEARNDDYHVTIPEL